MGFYSLGHKSVWLFALASVALCIEYCDDRTWYKYANNCYSFESDKQKLSYYDAEDYCRSKGSHLASIHSQEESLFLLELVESRYGGRRWIGLNGLEGKPAWSDGSAVDYLNVYNKTQYKKESCFMLYIKGSFRPEHCELRYIPICKRPADVQPTPIPPLKPIVHEGNCPADWLQHEQKCFKFFGKDPQDRKKFKDAKLACMALGKDHDLVSIHNDYEQAFLISQLGDFGTSVWIGLSHVESDEIGQILVFGWTDNSRMDYSAWALGHPLEGTWKNCARLQYDGPGKGQWISDYCDINPQGYICERPPNQSLPIQPPEPSKCSKGSLEYNDDCYKLHSDRKSWQEAQNTCRSEGGHLVSIANGLEDAFLFQMLKNTSLSIWNGLTNVNGTRILRWTDNTPLYYTNFEGLPDIIQGHGNCFVMKESGYRLKWEASLCDQEKPFICKKSNKTYPEQNNTIGHCKSNETLLDIGDNYCYHVGDRQNDRLRWGSLVRYCLVRGMEMVTVNNEHQQKSLMAYVWKKPYNFWLGLIRALDKQYFMWTDQSSVNYTNWRVREPSSWSNEKDCVSVSTTDEQWSVDSCDEWRGTICQIKKTSEFHHRY